MSFLLLSNVSLNSFLLSGSKFIRKLSSPSIVKQSKRTLLSSQYSCSDEWKKRLDNDETLKHISTERYFFELNQKYQQKQPVSAVDIDIFINLLQRPESQVELEHIIKRFRQTPKTVDTLESTHHAVCRYYLENDKLDELLKILQKRVEFGIFPDHYACNIIIDQCIKSKQLDLAFDVIKLMMLQEDSGNEITKTLALYVLNQFLIDEKIKIDMKSNEDTEEKEDSAAADDEDIEYIRVPYLTNPYFDDHFDLVDQNHLFGKSMYFFCRELEKSAKNENDQILANTGMVLGLIYYQKWDKLLKLLDRKFSTSGNIKFPTTSEPFQIINKCLELSSSNSSSEIHQELTRIKKKMDETVEIVEGKTLSDLIAKRIEIFPQLEPMDREKILEMFEQFKLNRIKILQQQMESALKQKKIKDLEQKQKEFEQKKRLFYFFENFPKHEIDFVEAERRIEEIRSKTIVEEDYVPPERY